MLRVGFIRAGLRHDSSVCDDACAETREARRRSYRQPHVHTAYSCSGHYGIQKASVDEPQGGRKPGRGAGEEGAKQGGAPIVNRMFLPRILVQGTMVFRSPPPMSRKAAGGPEEAPARKARSKAALLLSAACSCRVFLFRALWYSEGHRRRAARRQEGRKRRLRGNSRSKASLLPSTAWPYLVFLFRALWDS